MKPVGTGAWLAIGLRRVFVSAGKWCAMGNGRAMLAGRAGFVGRLLALVFLVLLQVVALSGPASADRYASWFPPIQWHSPFGACKGNCAVHIAAGQAHATDMTNAFALSDGFVPDASRFVAPWAFDYQDSWLVSAAVSRRVLTFGGWASAELEAGFGQRFGDMKASEVWGVVYLRWHAFPWNAYLKTTAAISTGLSYATRIDDFERNRDAADTGSRLLHYLSPEITFALPDREAWELVFRFHHRSGGGNLFGDTALFKGVTGGANHMMVGVRHRF